MSNFIRSVRELAVKHNVETCVLSVASGDREDGGKRTFKSAAFSLLDSSKEVDIALFDLSKMAVELPQVMLGSALSPASLFTPTDDDYSKASN